MWKNKKISVIFPTYNEKKSIKTSINDFFSSGYIDEIIVVNNNAAYGTSKEVSKTKAKEVYEHKQGYGHAIRKGLKFASGDYIILAEPDGTFLGRDIIKLLAYSDDFDVVFGSRTSRNLIWEGANIGFFIKWGNVFIAKLMELLYNTSILTDVGCTMRLIKRSVLQKIEPYFTIGGSHFGVEMMLLIIKKNINFMEIPLNYKKRVGKSSVTGSKIKAFLLGLVMIGFIIKNKFRKLR